MAKGFEKNKERLNEINRISKSLVKRAGAKCELCESGGVKLQVMEIAPDPEEVLAERCIMICDKCQEEYTKKKINPEYWRFLSNTIWSETVPVQALAYNLLNRLSGGNYWAQEILDSAYVDENVIELSEKI